MTEEKKPKEGNPFSAKRIILGVVLGGLAGVLVMGVVTILDLDLGFAPFYVLFIPMMLGMLWGLATGMSKV